MNIANKNANQYVEGREVFQGSHLFSEQRGNVYVVFSYGYHFPLFICKEGLWYANQDKYSMSTSRHKSQARPNCSTIPKTTSELQAMLNVVDRDIMGRRVYA